METTKVKLNTVLLIAASLFLLEWIGLHLKAAFEISWWFVLCGVRIADIAVVLSAAQYFEGTITSIGIYPARFVTGIRRGFFWAAGFGCLSAVGFLFLYFLGRSPLSLLKTPVPPDGIDKALFFFVGGVIGPLAEELFFRGVLYSFFRRWGIFLSIAITTLLFVSLHSFGDGLPLTQIIGGILFCIAFEIEKDLLVPVAVHVLGNLSIFSISVLIG